MRKLLAVMLILVAGGAAQQTCPISVHATIADRAGVVMDLQAADFSVKLDGREVPVKAAEVHPTPHFFIVLDASGSMVDTSGRGNRKWHAMLAQATSIVSKTPQGTAIGVLSFRNNLERRLDLTRDRDAAIQQIAREASTQRSPMGKTSLWNALRHAGDLLRGGDFIVALTDGGDNSSTDNPGRLAAQSARDSRVPDRGDGGSSHDGGGGQWTGRVGQSSGTHWWKAFENGSVCGFRRRSGKSTPCD